MGRCDGLVDDATVGEAGGELCLRPGVTVESDEETAIGIDADELIVEAQFRRRGWRYAGERAALLRGALKGDASGGDGSRITRCAHTAGHQQKRGCPAFHRRRRAFNSAWAEASALA